MKVKRDLNPDDKTIGPIQIYKSNTNKTEKKIPI